MQAATQRLRPILMTTGAMVLGALPLALAKGAGAESRQPIGWVIVGGMSLGTLLTLFVVPTLITLLARQRVPGPKTEAATTMAQEQFELIPGIPFSFYRLPMQNQVCRIAVFYDGSYFKKVSDYYLFQHERRARLSIKGLHEFIAAEVARVEGLDARQCQIVDASYFRGRLTAPAGAGPEHALQRPHARRRADARRRHHVSAACVHAARWHL